MGKRQGKHKARWAAVLGRYSGHRETLGLNTKMSVMDVDADDKKFRSASIILPSFNQIQLKVDKKWAPKIF